MNRRDSLRLLGIGTLSAGAVLEGCQPKADSANKAEEGAPAIDPTGREAFEIARDKELMKQKFFDAHEMATITLIADLIIPKDEHSGSASDAGGGFSASAGIASQSGRKRRRAAATRGRLMRRGRIQPFLAAVEP